MTKLCEPCALREAGEIDSADKIEAMRAHRLTLALLNGAKDAAGEIATELRGRTDCIARLAGMGITMYASSLAHMAGSEEAAENCTEQMLAQELDDQ